VGSYVDWYKVVDLGGDLTKGKYGLQKAKQDQKYGKPKVDPVKKVVGGKPIKVTGTFEVMPGQTVEIYERMAA
jgi:hypothetical protein